MTTQDAKTIAVRLLVSVTLLAGWIVALRQLVEDGWVPGGGTAWLLGLALLATLAAAGAAWLQQRGHAAASWVCLLFVALSPTVFAYVLNVAVIVLALALIGQGLAARMAARRSVAI